VVLLDFWASWCAGCMVALPNLRRIDERFRPAGLLVVGVNEEPDQAPKIAALAAEKQLRYPIVLDRGPIEKAFGVYGYPTVVLLDRQGVIRFVGRGGVTEEQLIKQIEPLLR
jgi:cytochrome c biogenesis protein CcmG/thiol:disulfide interchange protein DsbE